MIVKMAANPEENGSMEYNYELKIPKERVAVLIGKRGSVKKEIEEATNSRLDIDSEEGDVAIKGTDTIGMFSAREIVKAIGRGFNPEIAKLLLKQDYALEVIPITDYAGKSKSKILRMKGRLIGKDGRARRNIEQLTETYICVYGKTASIIGMPDNVSNARRAIESLFAGSLHASVYRWLEKKRRELKIREITGLKLVVL